MELNEFQKWLKDYYDTRGWSDLSILRVLVF